MKNYIKPQIRTIQVLGDTKLMSASTNSSKINIVPFTPETIPDADENVDVS
jgi:hypothetical protein